MSPLRHFLALSLAVSASPLARADEVLLVSGERLIGKVVSVADGKMTFESAGIGSITLDLAKVKTFATDGAVEIHLKDGTVVNQPAQASEEGKFSIGQAGGVPPRSLPLSEIDALNPPKLEVKWTGSATAGANLVRGNTRKDSASVVLDAVRRSEVDRISLRGEYAAAREEDSDGDRSTSQRLLTGSLKYDYFLSDRSYLLASAKADSDATADLNLRLVASGGYGYQWVETDETKLSTEIGVGWAHEDYQEPDPPESSADTNQIAARLAYRFEKELNPSLKFLHPMEAVHGFDDPHDFLVQTEWALRASLTKSMYSEGRIALNWDSTPAVDKERTDVRYILGFGWSF